MLAILAVHFYYQYFFCIYLLFIYFIFSSSCFSLTYIAGNTLELLSVVEIAAAALIRLVKVKKEKHFSTIDTTTQAEEEENRG